MAELDVRVTYPHFPTRLVFGIMAISLPVWGVVFPVITGFIIFNLLWHWPSDFLKEAGFAAGLILWSAISALLLLLSWDNKLILNQTGISFPYFVSPCFGSRRSFNWSDIVSIRCDGEDQARLLQITSKHTTVQIDLGKLSKQDKEKVLLGVELWGKDSSKDISLLQLKQPSIEGSADLSYTTMWEDELARRFTSTGFIPLEPGTALRNGTLSVVRQLSFGGLSAIYLCQKDKRDLVVLKEAVLPHVRDEEVKKKAEEMFNREAALLAKLDHPRLVKVLDHFVENGRHYLLLQYVNGQDLRQLVLQHGKQSEATVIEWSKQVTQVLEYLHSQTPPIIHRDVTPDNIVLSPAGEIVLIDFGAANEFIGNATGTLVGKQSFISPEQFRGNATPASDIFSFGGTIHFLLTGEEPVALSVSHPRILVPIVSEGLDTLVAEMTALDLKNRIVSTSALYERLDLLSTSS